MPRKPLVWLVADTHFFHHTKTFTAACHRPPDCDERMMANLRRLVAPQDMLLHLGDVIFYNMGALKPSLDSVPGRKILVRGNHDRKSTHWYLHNGFSFVCDALELKGVLFTHEPRRVVPDHVLGNAHGHWHNLEPLPDWHGPRHYLVAMERTNYHPVNLDCVLNEFHARLAQ